MHDLKIKYGTAGSQKEISLTLSQSELEALKQDVDRAIAEQSAPERIAEAGHKEQNQEGIISQVFHSLAAKWQEETRFVSSTNKMCSHPYYQQIIGLGEPVIPLLLKGLEQKTGRWFWALQAISRENPVPMESQGKTKEMIAAWLHWGRTKGIEW